MKGQSMPDSITTHWSGCIGYNIMFKFHIYSRLARKAAQEFNIVLAGNLNLVVSVQNGGVHTR